MHRPRTDGAGGGQRHKKRVRTPHNTREKQRQIAIGQGETLMPNNVIYRTPNSVINEEPMYNNNNNNNNMSGQYQNRPSSIELRRSYPNESVDGYATTSPTHPNAQYATAQHQIYDESIYNSQNLHGAQSQMSPEYGPGTPTRKGPRPTQPPPAPPSAGNTPNASNANTPTRGRSMSTGRDALPPPPPVPLEQMSPPLQSHQMHIMTNGNAAVAAKIIGRSHSTSRSGSPQLSATGLPIDPNALVMAQLNSQINNLNNLNLQMTQQMIAMNDLPPPPPIPDQVNYFHTLKLH